MQAVFGAALDRLIPADEAVPLKGALFVDFEDQVEVLVRAVAPTALEERAALADSARVDTGGRCPHCGSARVYLEKQVTQPELRSPHGPVVVPQQQARCRACGGSFSPAGAGLGVAQRGGADGACSGAGGARDGRADV
jgi:DNA-directed RNA polymerase subunit RPC12/RpoP